MKNNCPTNNKSAKGFTLIELLIVIAVLGVLAAVVLVAINPLEQLARGRDSGRKTTIGQLKNAVQAFYTSHNATYVSHLNSGKGWVEQLTEAGELKAVPARISSNDTLNPICVPAAQAAINSNEQNGWCYYTNYTQEAVVYVKLESKAEQSKCGTDTPYFLWSSEQGQAGIVCEPSEPTGFTGFVFKN